MAPTRVFIRDDDIGALTPALSRFVPLFAGRGIPVSYQIIPERLTAECAAFLLQQKVATPELLEFGQHGLRHQMTVGGKLLNHEFGPQRTYDQQLADIVEGRAILRERLGAEADIRVFTPPRHRYDRNTLAAIKASGFSVLSASSYTTLAHRVAYAGGRALGLTNLGPPGVPHHGRVRPDSGLFELSVAVGVDDGHDPLGEVETILARIEQARPFAADVGVLFHHEVFKDNARAAYLEKIADGIARLPNVTFHTISGLYDRLMAA